MPIYLDSKLQIQLERIAEQKGKALGELVAQLLAREIKLLNDLT